MLPSELAIGYWADRGKIKLRLSLTCKVKLDSCPAIFLKSKSVSYSWFPVQVGTLVMNLGVNMIEADAM